MSSRAARTRNNVKAGIFVSIGLLLAFTVILVVSDWAGRFAPRHDYVLRFSVGQGVEGLSRGAAVRVGGLDRGNVISVAPEIEEGRVSAMLVRFELDRDIQLFDNARAERVAPLIGNIAAINFSSVGGPDGKPLPPGATLDAARDDAGPLGRFIGEESARHVASVLATVDELAQAVRADYGRSVAPALRRLDEALADAREVVAAVRRDYPGWSERVSSTLAKADSAAGKLDEAMDDGRALVAETRAGVGEIRAVVSDNRGRIDEIVENTRRATGDARAILRQVREETMARVDAILARGQEGIDAFTKVLQRLREEVDLAAPRIDAILADARLTAQQLKLTSIEVRRSPWRLLYRPEPKELEHELLYEATRSFAIAAADLESTSASLDRVLSQHADTIRSDPKQAERLRQLLEHSLRRYEEAQARLFTVLLEDSGKQ